MEALKSALPIAVIVFAAAFVIAPVENSALVAFVAGAAMLVAGMALFTLGVDVSITPIGEYVGQTVTKSKKLWVIGLVGFTVGMLITISEPDLQVLAGQVPGVPNFTLIMAVAAGVGLFLAAALFRILFGVSIRLLLAAFYIVVFALSFAVPKEFLAVAFDSGGVTTGPMTVPFILSLGVGLSSIRGDANSENDCFGLVALCSVGPILAVMLLGIFYSPDAAATTASEMVKTETSLEVTSLFVTALPEYMKEVALGLSPVAVMYIAMRALFLKLDRRTDIKIAVGLIYAYIGLVLFLTGVNVGFMPVGNSLGRLLGATSYNWVLVPLGMIIGYFIVAAEPAVHVLSKQVYEITAGAIPQRALSLSLSIGVSVSVGLALLRVLLNIDIMYILAAGYLLAFALMPFTPPIFTSIAFDSGGVASGAMTATFLLPLTIGANEAVAGGAAGSFGAVAMVAMTPLITIQILGIAYEAKRKKRYQALPDTEDIIEL